MRFRSETLNERAAREARERLETPTSVMMAVKPVEPSSFLGVDAFRLWRVQRKARKMAKRMAKRTGAILYDADKDIVRRGPRETGGSEISPSSHTHSVHGDHTHAHDSARRIRGIP